MGNASREFLTHTAGLEQKFEHLWNVKFNRISLAVPLHSLLVHAQVNKNLKSIQFLSIKISVQKM